MRGVTLISALWLRDLWCSALSEIQLLHNIGRRRIGSHYYRCLFSLGFPRGVLFVTARWPACRGSPATRRWRRVNAWLGHHFDITNLVSGSCRCPRYANVRLRMRMFSVSDQSSVWRGESLNQCWRLAITAGKLLNRSTALRVPHLEDNPSLPSLPLPLAVRLQ